VLDTLERPKTDAEKYRELIQWRESLKEHIVKTCFDKDGIQILFTVVLEYGLEDWLPGSFEMEAFGRRFLVEFISLELHSVKEIEE